MASSPIYLLTGVASVHVIYLSQFEPTAYLKALKLRSVNGYRQVIKYHFQRKGLSVSQKTAGFINHGLRSMLPEQNPELLSRTIEIDETYVGGKEINKHESNKIINVFNRLIYVYIRTAWLICSAFVAVTLSPVFPAIPLSATVVIIPMAASIFRVA